MRSRIFSIIIFINFILLINAGCAKKIESNRNISGTKPPIVLINPRNELVTPHKNQIFQWSPVDGAGNYELQIVSPSYGANSNFILDTTVTSTSVNVTLEEGFYSWCVNATNAFSVPLHSDTSVVTIH